MKNMLRSSILDYYNIHAFYLLYGRSCQDKKAGIKDYGSALRNSSSVWLLILERRNVRSSEIVPLAALRWSRCVRNIGGIISSAFVHGLALRKLSPGAG